MRTANFSVDRNIPGDVGFEAYFTMSSSRRKFSPDNLLICILKSARTNSSMDDLTLLCEECE